MSTQRVNTASPYKAAAGYARWLPALLAIIQALFGLAMLAGGIWLIAVGGTFMYVVVGIGYLIGAWHLWRRNLAGVFWSIGTFLIVLLWSLIEAGLHFWPQIPRLVVPAVLAMIVLLITPLCFARTRQARLVYWPSGAVFFALLLATLFGAFYPHGVIKPNEQVRRNAVPPGQASGDWTHYGRNESGTRFAPFDQINTANVSNLKVAWTYRTGDTGPGEDQNVPLQIGNTLYTCSRNDHIAALDADTGKVRWTFDPRQSPRSGNAAEASATTPAILHGRWTPHRCIAQNVCSTPPTMPG